MIWYERKTTSKNSLILGENELIWGQNQFYLYVETFANSLLRRKKNKIHQGVGKLTYPRGTTVASAAQRLKRGHTAKCHYGYWFLSILMKKSDFRGNQGWIPQNFLTFYWGRGVMCSQLTWNKHNFYGQIENGIINKSILQLTTLNLCKIICFMSI